MSPISSYYMLKLIRKKRESTEENKKNLTPLNVDVPADYKCRICLNEGNIPIFANTSVVEAVRTFGDIKITEEDTFPKYLCNSCFDQMQAAITFRKNAKRSAQILTTKLKKETKVADVKKEETKRKPRKVTPKTNRRATSELLRKYFKPVTLDIKVKTPRVQCQVCNKIISKTYYIEHFAFHNPSVSHYVCEVCGKSFRQRCAYKNHIPIHSNEFPHGCELCEYKARTVANLKDHMKTHKRDYRYLCSECPARFLTKSNLNRHVSRHKEPMFHCEVCNKAYYTEIACKRHHEVAHLGLKKHVCDICGKTFGYRKALRKHQIGVHNSQKRQLYSGRPQTYLQHLGTNTEQVPTVVQ